MIDLQPTSLWPTDYHFGFFFYGLPALLILGRLIRLCCMIVQRLLIGHGKHAFQRCQKEHTVIVLFDRQRVRSAKALSIEDVLYPSNDGFDSPPHPIKPL